MTDHGEHDAERETERAWQGFRARLADRLAAFEDDEVLVVEVQVGIDVEDLEDAAPYLQFCGWGGELLRAEVSSNHHLDPRFALSVEHEEWLCQDWRVPGGDEVNYHQDVQRRDADRIAVQAVEVLRSIWGVLHPSFLDAGGLEADAEAPVPEPAGAEADHDAGDPDAVTVPRSRAELQALVDAAMTEVVETLDHDEDGDVPVRVGSSVVFVRVLSDRPAVEVFAELVSSPADPARLPVELDILNRSDPIARFAMAGTSVRMSYVLPAWPFVPRQLHLVVRHFLDEADGLARDLATRVGGLRFLEEPEPEHAPPTPQAPGATGDTGATEAAERHEALTALVEMLELGPVSSPVVAHLFGHDRSLVIRHLVGLRTGRIDCGDADLEEVLTCLRRALRLVVDGEVPERRPRRLPPRRRTEQPSLLSDDDAGEDTLDLGHSA